MKLYILCFVIILLLAVGCVVSSYFIGQVTEKTMFLLDKAMPMEFPITDDHILQKIEAAEKVWTDNEMLLETLISHNDLEDVTTEFARLKGTALTHDEDMMISTFTVLLSKLNHIRESIQLSLNNIF